MIDTSILEVILVETNTLVYCYRNIMKFIIANMDLIFSKLNCLTTQILASITIKEDKTAVNLE